MTILRQDFIQSSMLASAEYDTDTKEMAVTFTNGKQYVYVDVDQSVYLDLVMAPSAGRYFNSIKAGLKQKLLVKS